MYYKYAHCSVIRILLVENNYICCFTKFSGRFRRTFQYTNQQLGQRCLRRHGIWVPSVHNWIGVGPKVPTLSASLGFIHIRELLCHAGLQKVDSRAAKENRRSLHKRWPGEGFAVENNEEPAVLHALYRGISTSLYRVSIFHRAWRAIILLLLIVRNIYV